jgi:hypothetical protein
MFLIERREGEKEDRSTMKQWIWIFLMGALLICATSCIPGCIAFEEKEHQGDDIVNPNGATVTFTQPTPQMEPTTPEIPAGMPEELYYELYGENPTGTHERGTQPADNPTRSSVSAAPPIRPSGVQEEAPLQAGDRPVEPRPPSDVTPIFAESYSLAYTDIGLVADVARAPLVIEFTTWPRHEDPYHCFLYVTVRDYETLDVVAEDGYGRIYSSDRTKRIVIREQGAYHINLYGNLLDVDLTVSTGG